jgi:predicted site-specific integrase-resolvase
VGRRGSTWRTWPVSGIARWMNELLVGYARVSTEQQDLTAQRNGLHALGVGDDRIYADHGLTGTNRDRPEQASVG